MIPTRLRVVFRRLGVVLLLVTLAGAINLAVAFAQDEGDQGSVELDPDLVARGDTLFQQNCALCHGAEGRGVDQDGPSGGPSLIGVGPASVDFMLRTGRMPIQDQRERLQHRDPVFDETDIAALTAYVTSLAPGEGPAIPDVSGYEDADLSHGQELFTTNCAACHGPTAAGVAVGQRDVSSNLADTAPVEIAEAVRTGPGVMPVFGQDVLTDEDLEAVVAWVVDLRERAAPGGASIGRSGPVSEGLIAWVVGLGLLGIIMYFLGDRTSDADHGDDHA